MRSNIDARVTFNTDYELYENYLYSPAAAKQALSNVEVYRAIHSQVRQWIRQMNHVKINLTIFQYILISKLIDFILIFQGNC